MPSIDLTTINLDLTTTTAQVMQNGTAPFCPGIFQGYVVVPRRDIGVCHGSWPSEQVADFQPWNIGNSAYYIT